MATPKKTVSKKSVSSKPMSKDSNSKTKGPASIERENKKDFRAIIDHTMDIGVDSGSRKIRNQADKLLKQYYDYGDDKVSGKTASDAMRDYKKLAIAHQNYEGSMKAKAPMGRKPATPPKKK